MQTQVAFLLHNRIYCCVMILAWIYFKDLARTLVQEKEEERVNEEQENNFMALAMALSR